ncbi:MAG: hypothetical protein L3J22_08290 [Xanthomonadales bacterium]|nr:hypothetical protein [Xanthomonadales bacterium]
MKTIVINQRQNEKVPFLRGILVRSLLDAGLPFAEADKISSAIREQLIKTKTISSEDLQKLVVAQLQTLGDAESVEQYIFPSVAPSKVLVQSLSDRLTAFSRGRLARNLQSAGVKTEKAEYITELIYAQLITFGIASISTCQLGYITYLCLLQEVGKKAANRYLVWSEHQRGSTPLMLLVGGTIGAGKSTVATELGHLLEIVRIQSTDMLREVMRMMVPKRLLPILHTSSFNAWKTLPIQDKNERDWDQLVAEGYQSQAELLTVPCEAVLQRAVAESVPVILEGVHVLPDLLDRVPANEAVIKVYVMLAVLRSKKLKNQLRGRGVKVPKRSAERYLDSFDSIWSLQSFLLSEADRCNVPIITAEDKRTVIQQILQQVNLELARHYSGTPVDIFGSAAEGFESGKNGIAWRDQVRSLDLRA